MASVVEWARDARVDMLRAQFDEEDGAVTGPASRGADDPASTVADPIDEIGESTAAPTNEIPKWVGRLNKKHAVAFVEGKTVILSEKAGGSVAYGTVNDLHNYYENDRHETERGSSEAITKAWMRHRDRRSYFNSIVFAPAGGLN